MYRELGNIRMNSYKCHHIESTSNTNVKRGVNELITNKIFQFVENMVIRGEISNRIRMDNAV